MAIIRRAIVSVYGLRQELDNLWASLQTNSTALGDLETSLQNALTQQGQTLQQNIDALNAAAAKKAANLSDLTDVAAARTNISVLSAAEVSSLIDNAKLALGTNFTVADNAERDAMTGLDLQDRVTVTNGGNWVTYGVQSVTEGVATFYVMTSKEEYESANSAAAVKVAYESNADTNAYTDAEQAKVGLISITTARDLDKLIQSDELVQDISGNVSGASEKIASISAVQSYVTEAVRVGGVHFKTENRAVNGDSIVLTYAPKEGMVLNFGTVRYIDGNDVASDIQVTQDVSDASGRTYTLAGDSAGQFDGKQVQIQYPYIEPAGAPA